MAKDKCIYEYINNMFPLPSGAGVYLLCFLMNVIFFIHS